MINKQAPKFYILILNYCSLEDTVECYKTAKAINYSNYQVLVMDNASLGNEGEALQKLIPADELMLLKKNTGYAGGNNIGIKLAIEDDAAYIFIVNPDVRLPPDCIKSYLTILQDNSDIGALNPVQLNSEGTDLDEKFSRGIFTYQKRKIPALEELKETKTLWESKTLYGAAMIIPVDVFKQVGGFDPMYFAYGEEEDLCRRIRLANYRLVVTSEQPINHLRTKEQNKTYKWRILFLRLRGKYLLILKNPKRSFLRSIKDFSRVLYKDLSNKEKLDFPYLYSHFFMVFSWLMLNLFRIYKHRKMDHISGAYLS